MRTMRERLDESFRLLNQCTGVGFPPQILLARREIKKAIQELNRSHVDMVYENMEYRLVRDHPPHVVCPAPHDPDL